MTASARNLVLAAAVILITGLPVRALACATCYGASDSPLAQGMNWGIITLLGFIGSMLAGIVTFSVHVARRSAALEAAAHSQTQTDKHP